MREEVRGHLEKETWRTTDEFRRWQERLESLDLPAGEPARVRVLDELERRGDSQRQLPEGRGKAGAFTVLACTA